jgi:hypothetical protein
LRRKSRRCVFIVPPLPFSTAHRHRLATMGRRSPAKEEFHGANA